MKILFDTKLRRPGCVILQAMACDDSHSRFLSMFPSETWLVHPTPDMAVFEADDDQLEMLAKMAMSATREKQ